MPLVKRGIKPQHMCRGALPEGVASELECVTNNTLSAIIRQLSSLSKHAEDVFGELFDEANTFHVRANSLQDRIDRLAIKVTRLDSGVEEVSLQDINMRKAFRSVSAQDQQVVSRSSIPVPVGEMYESCERPPPLDVLSEYREDHADGMKFYTDPSYFFDLWKEKMLQDTEDKKREKRRQREQKSFEDGTLQREVKKVRKARNRRQEWNMMAFDKELRPDRQHSHVVQWGVLSEGSLSPTARMDDPNLPGHAHFLPDHVLSNRNEGVEHEYQSIGEPANMADGFGDPIDYRFNPPPPPHTEGGVNGDIILPPVDYGFPECFPSSCPPPDLTPTFIPSPQTAFTTPLTALPPPLSHSGPISSIVGYPLPPVPSPGTGLTPPPPGPPPPPVPPAMSHLSRAGEGRGAESPPVAEGRSDLLSAIRMGIQLKKVQEQQEQRAIRERSSNDVASILSRRIAVEYSDSEEESELEENEWTD